MGTAAVVVAVVSGLHILIKFSFFLVINLVRRHAPQAAIVFNSTPTTPSTQPPAGSATLAYSRPPRWFSDPVKQTAAGERWLYVGCGLAMVHAGCSFYWALGGRYLLNTVGGWAVDLVDRSPSGRASRWR